MILANLAAQARREKVMDAVDGILRQIDTPIGTAELARRVKEFLNADEDSGYVAKEIQKGTPEGHPLRRPTGETFKKFGKMMPRYEWLPSHKAGSSKREDPDLAARRAAIKELEALDSKPEPDEWEWTPPVDEAGFLED